MSFVYGARLTTFEDEGKESEYGYVRKLIRFFMSSNLAVTGIRIQNSPQFHMKFDGCNGVLIEKRSISSPGLSPNTNGIDIENTKSVGIYNSIIANGKIN